MASTGLILNHLSRSKFLSKGVGLGESTTCGTVGSVTSHLGLNVLRATRNVYSVTGTGVTSTVQALAIDGKVSPQSFTLITFKKTNPVRTMLVTRLLKVAGVLIPAMTKAFST